MLKPAEIEKRCLKCLLPDCDEKNSKCLIFLFYKQREYQKKYMPEYAIKNKEKIKAYHRDYMRNYTRKKTGSVRKYKDHQESCEKCGKKFTKMNPFFCKNLHKNCYMKNWRKKNESD